MRSDVVIVGGGTAGCVLAARLSETPERHVCLIEAGPDYGPLSEVAGLRRSSIRARSHGRTTGVPVAKTVAAWAGGSSAARRRSTRAWCSQVPRPTTTSGEKAGRSTICGPTSNAHGRCFSQRPRTQIPRRCSRPRSSRPRRQSVLHRSAIPMIRVLLSGSRRFRRTSWRAGAGAQRSPISRRRAVGPTSPIEPDTLVDRVELADGRATGVTCADGRRFDGDKVILAAGAYFSPAILLRSGIGPEAELRELRIPVAQPLPVGERLLDHCGTDVSWELTREVQNETAAQAAATGLFEAFAVAKAASTMCESGSWDLHLLPWIYPIDSAGGLPGKLDRLPHEAPLVRTAPTSLHRPVDAPLVERGFLTRREDVLPLLEGIELARSIGAAEPLRSMISAELSPGATDPERYLRDTIRNYFHPAGTCPIGSVSRSTRRCPWDRRLVRRRRFDHADHSTGQHQSDDCGDRGAHRGNHLTRRRFCGEGLRPRNLKIDVCRMRVCAPRSTHPLGW